MQDFPAMTQVSLVVNLARMSSIHTRIKELREAKSMSMEGLAAAIGVSWQTVQQWENGKTAPKRKRLEDVAQTLSTTVDFLLTGGPDEDPPYVAVRRLDVRFSAGHGSVVISEDEKSRLWFRADFLRAEGSDPEYTVVADSGGDSMFPAIPDKATVLLNLQDKTIRNRKIYAFRLEGHLHIKRFSVNPKTGFLVAKSDNEAYADIEINPEQCDFELIGRAFWFCARL
ncbi:XRE family transcriptional regulator [Achromobacter deleyi]|uniref:XRE family transcriptional regulator n=1 Tax=Achromobacter deleyi TaxID=1353891 RepID=UPI00158383E5|nr:XRE family transcriptional regulator [Achromobacter deleyi]